MHLPDLVKAASRPDQTVICVAGGEGKAAAVCDTILGLPSKDESSRMPVADHFVVDTNAAGHWIQNQHYPKKSSLIQPLPRRPRPTVRRRPQ